VHEQLLRFFDFGEISPRFKIDEDWREHLGDGRHPVISHVKARKSKCAAQLERFRLLALSDLHRSVKGIFGGGNVRRVTAQQKVTANPMQFGIQPMLAGLFRPADQLS
jgi:hypothetical protein